jgi:catechol 2,3-dioxygenase-like lactoylglutathione lyase family enzyme
LGISHVSLSVTDLAVAVDFWVDVLGFEPVNDDAAFRFLLHPEARLAVVLTDHAGAVRGSFDELNAGLDHLALAVGNIGTLQDWATVLAARGMSTSGLVSSDAGHHLNFRAPGDIPIELFVIDEQVMAGLGLPADEPYAVTHH